MNLSASNMEQKRYLEALCANYPKSVIIGSIGSISYDLKDIPHDNKILLKGAMGAALGCGLGYALSTNKQVIVVIGDGSFLMSMGAMSTILKYSPINLRVVIMNNNSYASCGGQKTAFHTIKNCLPWMFEIQELE